MKWLYSAVFVAITFFFVAHLGKTAPQIFFAPPCTECFVLNYPDRDASPQVKDYRCGKLTYDGHKGTDFAIADEQKMAEGVIVAAAAPGKVLRVRDGVIDQKVVDRSQVKGKECGNGLVINHGNNWESQYCHLRKGSVRVRPGETVKTGTPLGLIGQSGLASFPHVHLEVRYQGKVIDPAAGVPQSDRCSISQASLWQPNIPYIPTGLIHAGFSSRPPTLEEVEEGKWHSTTLSAQSSAIVFWTRSYGVAAGDKILLELRDANNKVIIDRQETLTKANRIFLFYAGKRMRGSVPLGTWIGKFQLLRDGKKLIDVTKPLKVVP